MGEGRKRARGLLVAVSHKFPMKKPQSVSVVCNKVNVRKRETNAQRTAAEYRHRTTFLVANHVARLICTRREDKADLAPEDLEDLPANELKQMGFHSESKRWRQRYTYLGQTVCELCEFNESPAKFLRLVADGLEGKPPPYNKSDLCCDGAISKAYKEASRRSGGLSRRPSFSEFHKLFLKQPSLPPDKRNIETVPPSERSLRRSLRRLGYHTRPEKRGRPRKK
jgi:hypothetical protein